MKNQFLSTAIPYVNGPPHLGFALELVVADALARHARRRGDPTYFLTGTDENSLKNALAAEAAGLPTADFVARQAGHFAALSPLLGLSNDDFIRTGADPRHAPAVEKLWQACAGNGDIYLSDYEGLYCVGCEQFYTEDELSGGVCPEHQTPPERVSERNYFFRLSRYRRELINLIRGSHLIIRPTQHRNEVLAFLESPLRDLSISRSIGRARGWGLPVPGDASQVVYVWFDALANYISALGYAQGTGLFERFWKAGHVRHVIGKGVVRFHAVYWPAFLLSAGLPLPKEILVHGYLTIDGRKISKSAGDTVSPREASERFGTDALRYFLLRHIGSHRDGDFSWGRYALVYQHELANELGNLLSRVVALGSRYGRPDAAQSTLAEGLAEAIDRHLGEFSTHRALEAIWDVVAAANAYVNRTEPWKLAKSGSTGELGDVLAELFAALHVIGEELEPFLPGASGRLLATLAGSGGGPLFPREASSV